MKLCHLALAGLLAGGSAASAAVVVQIGPGTDVGGGLVSYEVHLVADNEDDIVTAWQGSISGPLNNILFAGVLPTPSLDNAAFLGTDASSDSHFMFTNDQLIPIDVPTETDLGGGEWSLSGTFGFKPAVQTEDLLLAQVVLPQGATATMTSKAGRSDGVLFDTNAVIPEPASIGLVAMAGLLALRRRH